MSWYRPGQTVRLILPLARLPGASPGGGFVLRQDLSVLVGCTSCAERLVGFGGELDVDVEVGEQVERVGEEVIEQVEPEIEAAATVIFFVPSTVRLRA